MRTVSTHTPALGEVAEFLRAHPPFDTADREAVERVAATAEVEFFAAGETIFTEGAGALDHLRVVRSGAVELHAGDRVLDLLGTGEMLGHPSMLSGLPAGFSARAHEDTLLYRIPQAAAAEVLTRPRGLPVEAEALQRVGTLVRRPPVMCEPDVPIAEVARRMTTAGATAALVRLNGSLGIVTDRDLRSRVLGAGLSGADPVTAAMTAPAHTVSPGRLAGEVLLEMLDRGVRHFPVVTPDGEVLGVVEDRDLVAAETHSSFHLRRAIARAAGVEELVAAAADLRRSVIALHGARLPALEVAAIFSVVVDALTRRMVELVLADQPEPVEFAWLALGSQARREATLGSDADSAIAWFGHDGDAEVEARLQALGRRVVDGLAACGLRPDVMRATAADPLFVRSIESWQRAISAWLDDPAMEKALILVSVVVDSRPVWGVHTGTPVGDAFRDAAARPSLMRHLARFALHHRPPTGFLRGLVVEHDGEHRGTLDIKHGGVLPIAGLARWAGLAAGLTGASTTERLQAAAAAGTLPEADAQTLADAFELVMGLRLEHHVEQARAGLPIDDHIDPATLTSLTRTYLKDAFRAVAAVQHRVSNELALPA